MARARAKPKQPRLESPPRRAASRPWTQPELEGIERAWAAGDGQALAALGAAVGVEFKLDALARIDRDRRVVIDRRKVLLAMSDAMASEHGIAVRDSQEFMRSHICIVAVGPGVLAIAFRGARNKGASIGDLWPPLRPWYRELGRNRERIDAWLAIPDAERIELAITAAPRAEQPATAAATRALIDAIVAAPDDDQPRLVLADLLQQQGDPHGELIMLMLQPKPDQQMKGVIDRMIREHGARIAGEVAQRATRYEFSRGFVTSVKMNAASFSAHGERLFADHPIRDFQLEPVNAKALAKLGATPALARVRRLKLEQQVGRIREFPLGELFASKYFTRLERLHFANWHASDWRAACETFAAPLLEELEIYAGDFHVTALIPLLTSATLPRLARLRFIAGMFAGKFRNATEQEADAIAEALAQQTKLTSFALEDDRCNMTAHHWKQIFSSPGGRALEALALEGDDFGDADVEAIITDAPCALRSLNLCRAQVNADVLLRLLRSPAGARVERLVTWASDVDPHELVRGLQALPAAHPLVHVGISSGSTDPVPLGDRFVNASVTDHPDLLPRGWV